jgi:glycosyltransferase involved in cell wall biosynthesis
MSDRSARSSGPVDVPADEPAWPVVLIVPAWNEAETIGAVLDEVPRDAVDRILVVDGGSRDGTAEIARRRGADVIVQRRRGYGAACLEGAEEARVGLTGDAVLVFLDADYSDPPAELPRIVGPILAGEADLVLGCRDLRAAPGAMMPHARLGNRLVGRLIWLASGYRPPDVPPFRAIRASHLALLEPRELTYGWPVEMVVKAARAELRIVAVPIVWRARAGGRSKVAGTLRGTLGAARAFATTAWRYRRWRPSRPIYS